MQDRRQKTTEDTLAEIEISRRRGTPVHSTVLPNNVIVSERILREKRLRTLSEHSVWIYMYVHVYVNLCNVYFAVR
jgi:hypothetical protein